MRGSQTHLNGFEQQELVAAIDTHSELTLKRAARRISAPTAQKYQRTSSSLGSDGERPLVETVDVLRRELALKGTAAQVVKQACAQLGVDTIGNALTQQANECWEIVMGK